MFIRQHIVEMAWYPEQIRARFTGNAAGEVVDEEVHSAGLEAEERQVGDYGVPFG